MPDSQKLTQLTVEDLREELRARQARKSGAAPEARAASTRDDLAQLDDKALVDLLKGNQKVIYGADDRVDVFQLAPGPDRDDVDSVVALFFGGDVTDNGNGTSTLRTVNYGMSRNLCSSERFRDQPVGAFCSGVLVGADVIATAGHCVNASNVTNVRFVFGFRMRNATTAETVINNSEIYRGVQVLGREEMANGADWALVRVDRAVPNHRVARLRRAGKIGDTQAVHVIGHPVGLPTKFAGGAAVRDNQPNAFFVANLDTYGGNSGSPVFNSATHEVEGILVRGERDFTQQGSCQVSLVCPTTGCRGEDSTRTTVFAHLLQPLDAVGVSGNARRVFGRDLANNTKSIYAVTSDGRLTQVWDANGWNLDFPAESAGQANLRFEGTPGVFGRDLARNTKSIYVLTDDGRLAQVWDDNGWHLDFPADGAGHGSLRFQGSPAVFGRDLARNTKSIYIVTSDGRLAQVWDDNGWHLDFPAESAGQASLRFQGSPAVFGRDLARNTKSIYIVTSDGRLAQVWDDNGWHLDFPADGAGQASLRFQGSPAVFGRDLARNTKSIYLVTTDGRLAQVWDDNGWHLDFPADGAGQANLRFQGSPAVFGRDLARNTKSIYLVTTDGRLAQVWDDNGWHLDFPADGAGHAGLGFQSSPAVFGRDLARNTKSIYLMTSDGRLAQVWDANGWNLDFPAELAGHSGLRFQGRI
jgi:predicted nucleic acid-binding protein